MLDLSNGKTTYNLLKKERIFIDKTLVSIFFKSSKDIQKKSQPIDINGVRYKLDLTTGSFRLYTKKEIVKNILVSVKRTEILLNMLLEMNVFDWFCTLTFDNDKIDRYNDLVVFKAYQKFINNIKKQFPSIGYVCVPERHENGCIHFHLLINGVSARDLGLVDSGKVCCSWAICKNGIASKHYFDTTKSLYNLTITDGLPIYNVTKFIYGFSTVTRVASRERCNWYVKKYISKALGSTDIFKKRIYYSSNLIRPTIVDTLIGSDFNLPKDVRCFVNNDIHLQNADYVNYNDDHNILQFWEDNNIKNLIDNGFIPLSTNLRS